MPVQNKPIIHARDHEDGGADPIRGLLPKIVGTVDEIILALAPGAYYKLNETTGDWADSADSRPATYIGTPDEGSPPTRGTDSDYDEADGGLCVTVNGPTPGTALGSSAIGEATSDLFPFAGSAPFTVSARVKLNTLPSLSNYSMGVCGNVSDPSGDAPGWGLFVFAYTPEPEAFGPPGTAVFRRQGSGARQQAWFPVLLETNVWYRLTGTYDGTTSKIYVDDNHSAAGDSTTAVSLPSGSSQETFRIGDCGIKEGFGGTMAPFDGDIDSVVVWNRALTEEEVGGIVDAAESDHGGEVVVIDPDTGEPVWAAPGTEVEHGDGDPDENPVTSPPGPYTGTPENPSGWHYEAHFEYVVLYDSSPGRFDVPPRKWVRVPFNTVRIQRRWETEVDGDFVDAWLPDDRGLTEHAKNGLLLITPGMTYGAAGQTISGWFSIEYPALNPNGLPNYEGDPFISGPDNYVRAARMVSVTSGQVLRYQPEPNYRRFFEWPFTASADGDALPIRWTVDNPYPNYPNWPARPLNKPPPYPKLSNAASLDNYTDAFGGQGFELNALTVDANLPAGHALALQAWQDSPWLLRFGTDKYPPYTPFAYQQQWRKRPALVLRFDYDPDTVDHDTGALL